ncbi:hypothetical protein [Actinomadura rugatobispora]|uniref:BFN domain-containing protein n=1 Tax=Actinomadura rugatobispora TaxID=1994 RepID=A0ABW1AJV8_9ACTN|nr:hypothetical protein GCM10010200_048750 [Actinomadura rugatobispora]
MPERSPIMEVALAIVTAEGCGFRLVETAGLLIAACARSNLWTLEVGKPHLPVHEFVAVMEERVMCCLAIEEGWARYEALGFIDARMEITTLPSGLERQARLEAFRSEEDAAQETLLAELRDALTRYERTMEWSPPDSSA